MKRSILVSVMIIGAAIGLMGAVWAAVFTTSGEDSGDITAITLSIDVSGTGSLDFEIQGGSTDCDFIVPGTICNDQVTVTNNSGVPVVVTAATITPSGDLQTCGAGNNFTTNGIAFQNAMIDGGTPLAANGGTRTVNASMTFSPGGTQEQIDSCQGLTGTGTVNITAANVAP